MKAADQIEQLAEDICGPILHEIVQGVRQIVMRTEPSATEIVKYGGIMFQAKQPFCGVNVYREHVSLEFGHSHQCKDAHGVLEGSGQFRHHIKLKPPRRLGPLACGGVREAVRNQPVPRQSSVLAGSTTRSESWQRVLFFHRDR